MKLNFWKISVTPLVVGLIAAILLIIDGTIAPIFKVGASFMWIAFINWNLFFGSSDTDRLKAVPGFIIGYVSANLIINFGNYFSIFSNAKIINTMIASVIAVFIINALVMYFQHAKKYFLDSIPAIFVGIALTFSGAGISLKAYDLSLLLIIMIYGILGLLCGFYTNYFVKKINAKHIF